MHAPRGQRQAAEERSVACELFQGADASETCLAGGARASCPSPSYRVGSTSLLLPRRDSPDVGRYYLAPRPQS